MNEARTFHCPACGAPLRLEGSRTVVDCAYCKNSIILPESIRGVEAEKPDLDEHIQVFVGDLLLLLANDRKIQAIKVVKKSTGLSLIEAKAAVEALEKNDVQLVVQALTSRGIPASGRSLSTRAEPVLVEAVPSQQPRSGGVAGLVGCTVTLGVMLMLSLAVIGYAVFMARPDELLAPAFKNISLAEFASYELTMEGEGIGPGQFTDPRAIAADREGNIYVADYMTGRVQSFDSQGSFRWLVNRGNKGIIRSMAIGSDGSLFLVSLGALIRLDPATGKEMGLAEMPPVPGFRLFLKDLAIGPDGRMVVCYNGEDILLLDRDLNLLLNIPDAVSSITGDSELSCQVGIDPLGNIFIVGSFNNRVMKYSPEGKYLNQFGGDTVEKTDGKFRAVGDLAVDNQGRVFVSDIFGIQVFDNDGRFISRFTSAQYAHGLNFDLHGNLYLADNRPLVARMRVKQ
jgi:hypothetical protein